MSNVGEVYIPLNSQSNKLYEFKIELFWQYLSVLLFYFELFYSYESKNLPVPVKINNLPPSNYVLIRCLFLVLLMLIQQ